MGNKVRQLFIVSKEGLICVDISTFLQDQAIRYDWELLKMLKWLLIWSSTEPFQVHSARAKFQIDLDTLKCHLCYNPADVNSKFAEVNVQHFLVFLGRRLEVAYAAAESDEFLPYKG